MLLKKELHAVLFDTSAQAKVRASMLRWLL